MRPQFYYKGIFFYTFIESHIKSPSIQDRWNSSQGQLVFQTFKNGQRQAVWRASQSPRSGAVF